MLSRLASHYVGGSPTAPQFSFKDEEANRGYTLECRESPHPLGYPDAVAGDPNVATLLQSLSPSNLVSLLASVLFERRVIIVSESLGTVTGCCIGVERLCHPISWEGVYITIMPNHLLDYCSAPMPFLVGLHSSNWKAVSTMPLDEHVLVLADEDKIVSPFNDLDALPSDLASKLKSEFKHTQSAAKKAKRPPDCDVRLRDVVAGVVDKLTGDFREHIRRIPDRKIEGKSSVEIDVDSFISSKPKAYHRARALLAASQSMRAFVDRRIDEICGPAPTPSPTKQAGGAAAAAVLEVPGPSKGQIRRGKRKSTKTVNTIKAFLKIRPDLEGQGEPQVFRAIWLGGGDLDESQRSNTISEHLVKRVLEKPKPPKPVFVFIFSDTLVVVEDKEYKVRAFANTRILPKVYLWAFIGEAANFPRVDGFFS